MPEATPGVIAWLGAAAAAMIAVAAANASSVLRIFHFLLGFCCGVERCSLVFATAIFERRNSRLHLFQSTEGG
jgi:hypothetical protein